MHAYLIVKLLSPIAIITHLPKYKHAYYQFCYGFDINHMSNILSWKIRATCLPNVHGNLRLASTLCPKKVIFTPPRSRGGVIFSLQFVCVCLSVCLSMNKITDEWMH